MNRMTDMLVKSTGGMRPKKAKGVIFPSLLLGAMAISVLPAPSASGQTQPGLNLQLYAGLSITGAVGTVYSVEYVTDLAQTNAWHCLEYLQPPASPYLWTDKSDPATGERFYRAAVFAAPTNMVFIPPGTFRMGSPSNELGRIALNDDVQLAEGPQTAVTISRGFWMGKYEVTQGEYQTVMGNNPSASKGGPNLPVESVTWSNATNYCGKLTEKERAAGRIPAGSRFRLPTEAEWEYASRAWTSTRFSYGDDPGDINLGQYAWFQDNSNSSTHPVGQKLPNSWGLYDMSGNVWEWCQDHASPELGGIALDPQGPTTGAERVLRGGSSFGPAYGMRAAQRFHSAPDVSSGITGFRIVLAPGQP
jgi:formylglycine-generating enzyme required for sulfatase activity